MKNKRAIALSFALICSAFAVRADTDSPAPDEESLRDPFWPIDYNGPKPAVVAVETPTNQNEATIQQPDQPSAQPPVQGNQDTGSVTQAQPQPPVPRTAEWPKLKVKGVMKGPDGKYVANIEGIGVVEAGRKCKTVSQGVMFIYRIDEITAEGVKITPVEARPLKQQ